MFLELIYSNTRFIKHSLFSYFVIILNILVSLYSVRENIHLIGSEQYGIWILVWSTANIAALLNLGYNSVAFLKFNEYKIEGKLTTFFSNNLFVLFVQFSILITITLVVGYFSEIIIKGEENASTFRQMLFWAFPGMMFTLASSSIEAILYYNFKFIYHRNILELTRLGIMNICLVIGLYMYNDIIIMPIIYSIVSFIAFAYSYSKFLSQVKVSISAEDINHSYFKNNFHNGMSFFLLNISSYIIGQADVFFISNFKNNTGLITMYSQSFRLQDIALKFIKKITEIKGPKILALINEGKKEAVVNIYNKLLVINLLASGLAFVVIAFFGKFLLEIWLGNTIVFDQVLIVTLALICITGSLHWVLWNFCNLTGLQKKVKTIVVIEILSNLIFSYFFIRYFGLVGLGIASILSTTITIIFMYKIFRNYAQSTPMQTNM